MSGLNRRARRAYESHDAHSGAGETPARTDDIACANESPPQDIVSSDRRAPSEARQVEAPAWASMKERLEAALRENARLKAENQSLARDLAAASRRGTEAHHLAYHDVLTGLPNRLMLKQRLQQSISEAGERRRQLALLFIDLDHFKLVNDRLGHAIGDRVLTIVASRLLTTIRTGDVACRYGGDEFVVLLSDVADSALVGAVVEKVRARLEGSYGIDGNAVHIRASIGFALYPSHGERCEALLSHADASMYQSKAARSSRENDEAAPACAFEQRTHADPAATR